MTHHGVLKCLHICWGF